MRKFRTSYDICKPTMDFNPLASLTVPDDSPDLFDLLVNNVNEAQLVPIFDPESKIRDPRSYTFADVAIMRVQLEAEKQRITDELLDNAKANYRRKVKADTPAPVI